MTPWPSPGSVSAHLLDCITVILFACSLVKHVPLLCGDRWSLIKLSLKAVSFSEKWLAGGLNGQPTHCRVSFTSPLLIIQVIVIQKAKCPSN